MNMNKYISSLKKLICVLSFIPFFIACDDDNNWERPEDMTSFIPEYSIGTIGSKFVSGNIATFNLEPHVYADFDFWKLKIRKIEFYIDDELVETKTETPFAFQYSAVGLSKGKHKLIMKVFIEDLTNSKTIIIAPFEEFEIVSDDTNSGLSSQFSYSMSGKDVKFSINSIEVSEMLSANGWSIKTVDFYLDDKQIGTQSIAPFSFSYTAKDLNKGDHFLTIKANMYNQQNGKETELKSNHTINIGSGANFDVDFTQFIKKGEMFKATPVFLKNRSDIDCEIKAVTYKIDDEEISTVTSAPFSLEYNLPVDEKRHKLQVSISYSDNTGTSKYYILSYDNIQFIQNDTHEYISKIQGSSNFFVGDVLSCFANVYCGSDIMGTHQTKIYLDNKQIGESSSFPYSCDYHLTKEDIGMHTLRFAWTYYDNDGNVVEQRNSYISSMMVFE